MLGSHTWDTARIDAAATERWMRILQDEKMVRRAPTFAELIDTTVVDRIETRRDGVSPMTLILTHSEITGLLDRAEVHKAVEMAFAGLATGDCLNPAPHALRLPPRGPRFPWRRPREIGYR